MRARSLLVVLALAGAVAGLSLAAATAGAAATDAGATATDRGATAAAGNAAVGTTQSAEPAVSITIDSTAVAAGDTYEAGRDVELTVDAAVGAGDDAGANLSEIVVRINDEHYRSVPLDSPNATRTIETDLRNGENDVRVIVIDDANNVRAVEFTVVKDAEPPYVFLESPYETRPWKPIPDGKVNGTEVTLAGKIIEDTGVETITIRRDYGDDRLTRTLRDVENNFSVSLPLGYSNDGAKTNRVHIKTTDEFGNFKSYSFTLNATDGAAPSASFDPHPQETTRNRIPIAGTVADDVWIDEANVTIRNPQGNRTGFQPLFRPRSYDLDVDRQHGTFNVSLYSLLPGTYEATVSVTDVAGKTTTETITVERLPHGEGDVAPEIAIDRDRTVVLDAETLFLSGEVFEGVVQRAEVETRDPDTGETIDYRVLHSGETTDRVAFDAELAVENRTEVVVRAIDADGEEHAERFFVDGGTREAFVGDPDEDDEPDEPRGPVVTVEPLTDDRPGTASSAVTVRGATPGTDVRIPAENGTAAVASTPNVTLTRVDLGLSTSSNVTATVTAREAGHGPLTAPAGVRAAGAVTLRHSLSAANVSGATLDLRVRRTYLDAHGFDPANLTVHRLSDGKWSEVPTTVTETSAAHVYYRVQSPGLSVFTLATEPTSDGTNGTDENGTTGNGTENPTGNESAELWTPDPDEVWPPGDNSTWDPDFETGENESGGSSDDSTGDGDESGDGSGGKGNDSESSNGSQSDGENGSAADSGEADILVTEAEVNRTEIGLNESVAINATLENSGNASGTYVAGLQSISGLNVTFVEKKAVTVPANDSETVGFTTAFDAPGNHTLSINGTQAGPVTVVEGGGGGGGLLSFLSVLSFLPLELIGMAIGGFLGLVLVLVLVRFVLRRVGGSEASG